MSGASMLFLLSFGAVLIQAISVSANVNANTNTNTNTNVNSNANAADRYYEVHPQPWRPRPEIVEPNVNAIPDDSDETLLAIEGMRRKLWRDNILKPGTPAGQAADAALRSSAPAIRDLCHAIAVSVRDAVHRELTRGGQRRRSNGPAHRRNYNSNVNSNVNTNTNNNVAPEYSSGSPRRPGGLIRSRPAKHSHEILKIPYYDPAEDNDDDENDGDKVVEITDYIDPNYLPEEIDLLGKESVEDEHEAILVEEPVEEVLAPIGEEELTKEVGSKSMMPRGWGHLKYPRHRGSSRNTNTNSNSNSNSNAYRRNSHRFVPRSMRRSNGMRRNNKLMANRRARYRRD